MFNRFQFFIRIFSLRQIPDVSEKPQNIIKKIKSIIRNIFHCLCQLVPLHYLKNKLLSISVLYNNTNNDSYCCLNFPKFKTEYVKKSDLYPLKLCEFEGDYFPIPNNWHIYLTNHYGDYMKLPPMLDRVGHRPYKFSVDKFINSD